MDALKPLKYINELPFPVTVKHYVAFGTAAAVLDGTMRSGEDWMVLRNAHPRYKIADTREEWLKELMLDGKKDGQDPELLARVKSFAALLAREHIATVYSIGSGGAAFEYYLKKHSPEVRVIATECTEAGVNRLKRVFLEADGVELFDALARADWERIAKVPDSIAFIYRNEREFTDEQWCAIFRDMHAAGVTRVFLGFMYLLTVRGHIARRLAISRKRRAGETISFAGYLRSFARLRSFWRGKYFVAEEIPFPTCTGLYLKRV